MICHLPQNYSSPIEYQNYRVTTMGVPLLPPPPPRKKQTQKSRTPPQKKTKKKKKKKEGAIFANPPSEDPLVYEPL